jgi:CheY-like chemotaxis protein
MRNGEKTRRVLVAAKEDLHGKLSDAVAGRHLELLYASTKQEALSLLESTKFDIQAAIVELEMQNFDGWDLVRRITFRRGKRVKVIATTSTYPESYFETIKRIGVDRVVTKTISTEAWRQAVEAALEDNEHAHQ